MPTPVENTVPATGTAFTGQLLLGYVPLVVVAAIAANLEGLLAGGMFGGRSPQVPATVPAGDLITWAAVLLWSWLIIATGAVRKAWWAISPLGIAVAAYALRVFIVGFHPGGVAGALIAPAMITVGALTGYFRGRSTAEAPPQRSTGGPVRR